jgi:uncharacterized phage protein (TIGR01671 family)
MNRDIKFRGKTVQLNEWVYGGFHTHEILQLNALSSKEEVIMNTHSLIIADTMADWGFPKQIKAHEVQPDTIGQFIGLKDKNGKEIYEGDTTKDNDGNIMQVVYVADYASFVLWAKKRSCHYFFSEEVRADDFEFTGNIHDNPELLK